MSNKPTLRSPMTHINFGLLLLLLITCNNAFAAAVYTVDIKKTLRGSKILTEINKLNVPGSITVLKLSNVGTQTAGCRAIFDPRMDQKQTFKRVLKPNEQVSIRHSTARPPNRVNIQLDCRPLPVKPNGDT